MDKLTPVKIKEMDDIILYVVQGAPPRFVEGEEYVLVKKSEYDNEPKYVKRKSLQFHWR